MNWSRLIPPFAVACASVAMIAVALSPSIRDSDAVRLPPVTSPRIAVASATSPAALAATILRRPLFDRSRRAALAAAVASGNGHAPRLAGTVVGRHARFAVLTADGEPGTVLREGDRHDGLLIRSISPGLVVAEGASGTVRLLLAAGPRTMALPPSAASVASARPPFAMTKDPRSRAADNQDE